MLEVNKMEHAETNRTRYILTSGLQTSRRQKNGYNSTLESLLGAARSLPQESSSGPVALDFGEAYEDVVDQLWVEVGPALRLIILWCLLKVKTCELDSLEIMVQ